jgi:hypothetical protein
MGSQTISLLIIGSQTISLLIIGFPTTVSVIQTDINKGLSRVKHGGRWLEILLSKGRMV